MSRPSPRCSIACFTTATFSSADPEAGGRKLPQSQPGAISDPCRHSGLRPDPAGAALLRPAKTILRRVNAEAILSSRWSEPRSRVRSGQQTLARMGVCGLEQIQILSVAHLAGFEVITHGRI